MDPGWRTPQHKGLTQEVRRDRPVTEIGGEGNRMPARTQRLEVREDSWTGLPA